MPTYQYREECRETFERTETISEHEAATPQCPKCGSKKVSAVPGRVLRGDIQKELRMLQRRLQLLNDSILDGWGSHRRVWD